MSPWSVTCKQPVILISVTFRAIMICRIQFLRVNFYGKSASKSWIQEFVWFNSLHPRQKKFSYVRTGLPGLEPVLSKDYVSCSRTQHSDASEAPLGLKSNSGIILKTVTDDLTIFKPVNAEAIQMSSWSVTCKPPVRLTSVTFFKAIMICRIQYFEADFLWKVSLKILNSRRILKTITDDLTTFKPVNAEAIQMSPWSVTCKHPVILTSVTFFKASSWLVSIK